MESLPLTIWDKLLNSLGLWILEQTAAASDTDCFTSVEGSVPCTDPGSLTAAEF